MEKKLYYKLEDNGDVHGVIFELSGVMAWIEAEAGELSEMEFAEKSYTIKPVYMTEEEFNNLPEADIF